MSDLPENWMCLKLEELVTIKYGKGLPTKDLSDIGYPVFGANGVIGRHTEYLYEDEQVLISCRGAYSGKINWSPRQCFVTNNSLILEVHDSAQLERKYLFYVLHTADKSQLVTGSAQPQVTINNAKGLLVPLAPLNEQKRIVAEIEKQFSRLDEAIANLKRVKANLKRYKAAVLKAAVLKAAVEGKLTEDWRKQHPDVEPADKLLERILAARRKAAGKGKYKEPVGPDTSGLPELPAGWVWASLGQITSDSLIGLDRGRDQQNESGAGIPYVKMNNVTMDGQVLFDELVYVQVSEVEKSRFSLEVGDVLFNTRNSKELVGKVGLVRQLTSRAVYNKAPRYSVWVMV